MGRERYPQATRLMITADGGGSNGSRNRLWKRSLQALADETGLAVMVCHFPPGTSKWNKIEHCLFSFISRNWRGRPLVSYEVIVSLIANTTNSGGLSVECAMDTGEYPKGVKVADDEVAALVLEGQADRIALLEPHVGDALCQRVVFVTPLRERAFVGAAPDVAAHHGRPGVPLGARDGKRTAATAPKTIAQISRNVPWNTAPVTPSAKNSASATAAPAARPTTMSLGTQFL